MEQELSELLHNCLEKSQKTGEIKINIAHLFSTIYKYRKNKYIKSFVVQKGENDHDRVATFFPKSRTIEFYTSNFNEMVAYNAKIIGLNERQFQAFLYSELFSILLHEVEHSNQLAKVKSIVDNSLEKQLLKYTEIHDSAFFFKLIRKNILNFKFNIADIKKQLDYYSYEWKIVYNELYDYMLSERLANIYSYSVVKKILLEMEEFSLIYHIMSARLIDTYLSEYNVETQGNKYVISPTIKVLEFMVEFGYFDKIPFSWYSKDEGECIKNVISCFNFETRYKYGLPITNEEYLESLNEYTKLKEKIYKSYGIVYRGKI